MGEGIRQVLRGWDAQSEGAELYESVSTLYPICRSITGDGLRRSLRTLGKYVPLSLNEVASGRRVFDWLVPNEWNVRDAYRDRMAKAELNG
jgi:aminopeptidase-like protein